MTLNKSPYLERHLLWQPWTEPGIEHLHLREDQNGVIADGLIVGVSEGTILRLQYQVHCTPDYYCTGAQLRVTAPTQRALELKHRPNQPWTDGSGRIIPELHDCIDIDITASPFTNTLPIRRLPLQPGESTEIVVAYIEVPQLTVQPERQRYTCLEKRGSLTIFHFEHLSNGFTAEIQVDEDGLVVEYPGLFRRVGIYEAEHQRTLLEAWHDYFDA